MLNHDSNMHVRNQKREGGRGNVKCILLAAYFASDLLRLANISEFLFSSLELLPNQIPTCQGYRVIVSKMSLTKNGHIFMQKKLMIANLGTCEYQCIFKIKNILVCTFYFRLRRKFEFRSMAINYKNLNLICFSDMI